MIWLLLALFILIIYVLLITILYPKSPQEKLWYTIQAIPMDELQRKSIYEGCMKLSDETAKRLKIQLETALQKLPEILRRLKEARRNNS